MIKHLNQSQAAYDKSAVKVVMGIVALVVAVVMIHGGEALPYLFGAVSGIAGSLAYLAFGGKGSKPAAVSTVVEGTGAMGVHYRGHTAGGGYPMFDDSSND